MADTCYIYILGTLEDASPRTYVGWTTDVARRLAEHNAGTGAKSTRGRVWTVIHTETFKTRSDAMSREWHLKRDRKFRKECLKKALG